MSIVKAVGATGDYRSNFMSKANTLIDTITNQEKGYVKRVHIHIGKCWVVFGQCFSVPT
jgi:hypothetical protein